MPSLDFYDAARAVLAALGAQETPAAVNLLVAWEWWEKPHDPPGAWQWNNPLNTTLDAPGAVAMNSVGVKGYQTAWDGAQAVAETIRRWYPTLTVALRQGDANLFFSPAGIRALSTWVTGDPDANPQYGAHIRETYTAISGEAVAAAEPASADPGPVAGATGTVTVVPAAPLVAAPPAPRAVMPGFVSTIRSETRPAWGSWALAAAGAAALLVGVVLVAGRRPPVPTEPGAAS